MDLRLSFNAHASDYDRLRPTYTAELFSDILGFSRLGCGKKALEIGIGTGQATLPFLQTGSTVTAIEIGDKLAQLCREKFAGFTNFDVINHAFESAALDENAYDLAYSASAFHWIPPEIGLPKVLRLLKRGGVFAWFSNSPVPSSEHAHIYEDMQKVYTSFPQHFGAEAYPSSFSYWQQENEKKAASRSAMLRQYGFADVTDKLYYGSRTFSPEDYAALLGTYSDHNAMPYAEKLEFLRGISAAIARHGGQYTVADIMVLSMGRKV